MTFLQTTTTGERHMTEQQTWTPGMVANGHILVEGEGWVPLAEGHQGPGVTQRRPSSGKPAWYRRSWVVGTAAGVLGLVLGGAAGSADPTGSTEYRAQARELA